MHTFTNTFTNTKHRRALIISLQKRTYHGKISKAFRMLREYIAACKIQAYLKNYNTLLTKGFVII